jgi:large subunit ribosomal protein L35
VPKLKTHKGAASRFRVTGTGKIMRMQGHRNNFRRKKAGTKKVWFARTVPLDPAMQPKVKRLLAGQD